MTFCRAGYTFAAPNPLDTPPTPCYHRLTQGEHDMTHTITALTNDIAKLIVKKCEVHNDAETAEMIRAAWEAQGFSVLVSVEY